MTDRRKCSKQVRIIVKRRYVGTADMKKLFFEVLSRALLKGAA